MAWTEDAIYYRDEDDGPYASIYQSRAGMRHPLGVGVMYVTPEGRPWRLGRGDRKLRIMWREGPSGRCYSQRYFDEMQRRSGRS